MEIDGVTYIWPILFAHPDGPFQQEPGNFSDMASFFPDYFDDGAQHDDYTIVSQDMMDPAWAKSVISSAISSVVTRETLWAVNRKDYNRLVFEAIDPWAELSIITYAYNRGIYGLCGIGLFADIDQVVISDNVAEDWDLSGFGDHVAQVNGIVKTMN